MSHRLRCFCRTCAVACVSALLLRNVGDLSAQQRWSVAGGPVVAFSQAPPSFGVHARAGYRVTPPGHRLSAQLEVFGTSMMPDARVRWTGVNGDALTVARRSELQAGATVVGILELSRSRVAPYLVAGGGVYWSRVSVVNALSGPTQPPYRFSGSFGRWGLDVAAGVGVAIRTGARRILLEVRPHSGEANYLALSAGLTL